MNKFGDAMSGLSGILGLIPGAQPFALGAGALGFLGNLAQGERNTSYMRPNYQFGGVMGKVEKGEVIDPPNGNPMEVAGGTHASGNDTTIMAPQGTEVFSDSIEIDGESMADRKKAREKRMKKLEKEAAKIAEDMDKNPIDGISRQSNKRVIEKVLAEYIQEQMQEEAAMQIQHIVSQSEGQQGTGNSGNQESNMDDIPEMKYGGKMKKYGNGGIMDNLNPNPFVSLRGSVSNIRGMLDALSSESSVVPDMYTGDDFTGMLPALPSAQVGGDGLSQRNIEGLNEVRGRMNDSLDLARQSDTPEVVGGQMDGLVGGLNPWGEAGSMANIFGPAAITLMQRMGDRRNPNYYEGFGADGLRTQGRAFGAASGTRDASLADVDRAEAGQRRRNQSGARGINTRRALDTSTLGQSMRQRQGIRDQYQQHIANLFRERAGVQNQVDRVRMGGAAQADVSDRQDRASFHTNLAKSIMQGGREAQHYGRMQELASALSEGRMSDILNIFNPQNFLNE